MQAHIIVLHYIEYPGVEYIAFTHLCANLVTPSLLKYAIIVLHLCYAISQYLHFSWFGCM